MKYTVYILLCDDHTLYTGITNDVDRRLEMHRAGKASRYTRARGVVKMVYTEAAKTRSDALKREAAIKKLSRAQKEELISAGKPARARRKRAAVLYSSKEKKSTEHMAKGNFRDRKEKKKPKQKDKVKDKKKQA